MATGGRSRAGAHEARSFNTRPTPGEKLGG